MKLKPGAFTIATIDGPFVVKGEHNGVLGFDARSTGFHISHLGTGLRVFVAPTANIARLAIAELTMLTGWDFDSVDGWQNQSPNLGREVKAIYKRFDCYHISEFNRDEAILSVRLLQEARS